MLLGVLRIVVSRIVLAGLSVTRGKTRSCELACAGVACELENSRQGEMFEGFDGWENNLRRFAVRCGIQQHHSTISRRGAGRYQMDMIRYNPLICCKLITKMS